MVNQIAGGKSPSWGFDDLETMGVSLVNYRTPCLFGAQTGMEQTLRMLKDNGGKLSNKKGVPSSLESCTNLLYENMKRRDSH
jgi:hypothetical protein